MSDTPLTQPLVRRPIGLVPKRLVAWILGLLLVVVGALTLTQAPRPAAAVAGAVTPPHDATLRQRPPSPDLIDQEARRQRTDATRAALPAPPPPADAGAAPPLPPLPPLPQLGRATASEGAAVDAIEAATRGSAIVVLEGGGGNDARSGGRAGAGVAPDIERGLSDLSRAAAPATTAPPAAGSADRAFLREFEQPAGPTRASVPTPAPAGVLVTQGAIVPAVLLTALDSDLPGPVRARVTRDVYDSVRGHALAIPRGSVLVGRYSADVRPGQDRLLLAFSRLILPDGASFELTGNQGLDRGGRAGLPGEVDNHFFRMFGASFLIAAVDRLVNGRRNDAGTNNVFVTQQGGLGGAAGQVLADTSRAILERNQRIAPTVRVEAGMPFNVEVARDLLLTGRAG